jgi:hypothetical protein
MKKSQLAFADRFGSTGYNRRSRSTEEDEKEQLKKKTVLSIGPLSLLNQDFEMKLL